jgi:predicted transcriptional regulator
MKTYFMNENQINIFKFLLAQKEPLSNPELAEHFKIPRTTIHKNLCALESKGLVTRGRRLVRAYGKGKGRGNRAYFTSTWAIKQGVEVI